MAEKNSKLVAFVAVLMFAAIGLIIYLVLKDIITNMNASGVVADILNAIKTPGLLDGLLWLVICIVVYIGVGKVVSSGEKVGPISIWFLLLWLGAVLGLFVGTALWTVLQGGQLTLTLDIILGWMFFYLVFSLGPAFAAALSISNK